MLQLLGADAVAGEVDPQQIGAVGIDDLRLRQVLGDEGLRVLHVPVDVLHELVDPVRAQVVAGDQRSLTHDVGLAVARLAVGLAILRAQLRIRDHDGRGLQAGDVEGLAGRAEEGEVPAVLLVEAHAGEEAMARKDEVAVDLVDHQDRPVFIAELCDLLQLLLRPDAAHRVVRAAEDQRLDLLLLELLLHRVKVDGVAPILIAELAVDELPPVLADRLAEGVVDRLHDHHGIAGGGEGPHADMDRVDEAGAERDPFRVHGEAVARGIPVVERFKIIVQRVGVAEDAVVDALVELGKDLVGQAEIHVRDPHGEQIVPPLALHAEIVFQAVGAAPVDDLVKIVFHSQPPTGSAAQEAFAAAFCSFSKAFSSGVRSRPSWIVTIVAISSATG